MFTVRFIVRECLCEDSPQMEEGKENHIQEEEEKENNIEEKRRSKYRGERKWKLM